jgi:hypothetical protein
MSNRLRRAIVDAVDRKLTPASYALDFYLTSWRHIVRISPLHDQLLTFGEPWLLEQG